MTTLSSSSQPEQYGNNQANVKVVVRIRPLINAELSNKYETVTETISDHMLVFDPKVQQIEGFLHTQRRNITGRRFKDLKYAFDHVLRCSARNRDVFEKSTQSIVKTVLNGYNCSVFAYGATGSGKTHTMLGNENEPGVIYHTMLDLYKQIDALKDEKIFNVAVSYLEIYNETVRDLLNPKKNLPIREDKLAGVMIAGLSLHKPECAEDLLHMLHHGNKNRSQHPTDANAESSRSHAVFQVYVKQRSRSGTNTQVQMAKMCLVDLAGSERAIHTRNVGARFREGANINRSLLALGNVINALAAKSKGHIPYRDSKLTRLLKDSLGGNCQTVMIATISPSSRSYEDTYNTLRYADRAKHIKADLTRNIVNVDQHIVNYKIYVADLERENRDLREKARMLQETGAVCPLPSLSVIKQIQDKMLDLFKSRKEIVRTQITSEVVKRELKWKLSRKERSIKRVEMLTGLKNVVSKHQRMVERMQCRYLKEEVNLQKSTQQLKQHDQCIYNLNAELSDLANTDKSCRELLAMSMRFYVTDSYLCDLDMHLCFVKKMARAQERQSVVNERIIRSLIQLVRKQQDILKNHNVSNTEVDQSYKECCYLVEERGVAWVQQHSIKTKTDSTTNGNGSTAVDDENKLPNFGDEEDKEDLRISDIIDIQLPKIALNSLKIGNLGSPPNKKKDMELHVPLQDEMMGTGINPALENMEVSQKSSMMKSNQNEPFFQSSRELAVEQVPSSTLSSMQPPARSFQGHEHPLTDNLDSKTSNGLHSDDKDKDSTTVQIPVNGTTTTTTASTDESKTQTQGMRHSMIPQAAQRKSLPNTSIPSTAKEPITPQKEENRVPAESGSSTRYTPMAEAKSFNNNTYCPGQDNSKTSVAVSVKKMVEKYSCTESGAGKSTVNSGGGGSDMSGCNVKSSVLKRNSVGNSISKRPLQQSAAPAKNAAVTFATNSIAPQTQPRQLKNNALAKSIVSRISQTPENKEDNENDATPTSDKLNTTFEINKPAIPNTPCIDVPVPKQRRTMANASGGNSSQLTSTSKKQSGGTPMQTNSPVSCHNNHSNSSYQQRFLNKQLSQTTLSSNSSAVDKPFNRRLNFALSTNNYINANDQKTKLCLESSSSPTSATKKNPSFSHVSGEIFKEMGDLDGDDASGKALANEALMFAKSNLCRGVDKLQKISKRRAASTTSRFRTSTPPSSPSSTSSPGVKSSPCLTKWELMRERGVTRGSKLWRSLSAQQLGVSNNNNSSLNDDDDNNTVVSPNTSQDTSLHDGSVKSSTPKMEVEVCISPAFPSQTHDTDKDGGSLGRHIDKGQGQTEDTKMIKTPEFKVDPYMQTVIRSLRKHGLPSLTERMSLLPGATTTSQGKDAPSVVSPPAPHRERSPLRLLDANSTKYQTRRPLGNLNSNKSSNAQEKQMKKVEPVTFALPYPLSLNTNESTTASTMKYRLDRVKERRHQRELSAKPYSRETLLANRGQRLATALKKSHSMKEITNVANNIQGVTESSNTNTAKPSYMLSTFAASQRATGPPTKDKGGHNNNNATNKLSSWSILSQQAVAANTMRAFNGQRNKSYLPW